METLPTRFHIVRLGLLVLDDKPAFLHHRSVRTVCFSTREAVRKTV